MADPTAGPFSEGAAFHCYGGDPSAMTTFHDDYPTKSIYMTECSGGTWQSDPFSNTIDLVLGSMANWAQAIALWNMALDENAGPQNDGCNDCRGVITVNSQSGDVTYNADYFALGHFSKFVLPGGAPDRVDVLERLAEPGRIPEHRRSPRGRRPQHRDGGNDRPGGVRFVGDEPHPPRQRSRHVHLDPLSDGASARHVLGCTALAALGAFGACHSTSSPPPPAASGPPYVAHFQPLDSDGKVLRDAQGRTVVLRGYNVKQNGIFDVTPDNGQPVRETIPPLDGHRLSADAEAAASTSSASP